MYVSSTRGAQGPTQGQHWCPRVRHLLLNLLPEELVHFCLTHGPEHSCCTKPRHLLMHACSHRVDMTGEAQAHLGRKRGTIDSIDEETVFNLHHRKVSRHGWVNKVGEPLPAIAHDHMHRCPSRAIWPRLLTQFLQDGTCP